MSIVPGPDMSKISLQLTLRDQVHAVADHRVLGHAALEVGPAVVLDLAEQVELAGRDPVAAFLVRRDLGDHADHHRAVGADAEELADGRPRLLAVDRADLRLAAGDRQHAPEWPCAETKGGLRLAAGDRQHAPERP